MSVRYQGQHKVNLSISHKRETLVKGIQYGDGVYININIVRIVSQKKVFHMVAYMTYKAFAESDVNICQYMQPMFGLSLLTDRQ